MPLDYEKHDWKIYWDNAHYAAGAFSNNPTHPLAPSKEMLEEAVRQVRDSQVLASSPFAYMAPGPASGLTGEGYISTLKSLSGVRVVPDSPQRYYDKHGTEIREGDTIERSFDDSSRHTVVVTAGTMHQWVAVDRTHSTVLSRADGTPVYRYKDGNDVRVGDDFRRPSGSIGTVEAHWLVAYGETESRSGWATCDLLRRKDGPFKTKTVETEQMPKRYHESRVEALERFLDWCNQPTLAQQFDAFRRQLANAIASLPGDLRSRVSTLTDVVGGKYGTRQYPRQVLTQMRIDDGPWYELGAFPLGASNRHLFSTIDSVIKSVAISRLRSTPRGPATPAKR